MHSYDTVYTQHKQYALMNIIIYNILYLLYTTYYYISTLKLNNTTLNYNTHSYTIRYLTCKISSITDRIY